MKTTAPFMATGACSLDGAATEICTGQPIHVPFLHLGRNGGVRIFHHVFSSFSAFSGKVAHIESELSVSTLSPNFQVLPP